MEGQNVGGSISQLNVCESNLLFFTFPLELIYFSVMWVLFKLPLDLNKLCLTIVISIELII